MANPPPGYDDETVVPQERLKYLLGDFESELNRIQVVFRAHLPGKFHPPQEIEKGFWKLRISAEELGGEYTFLVEKIINDYEHFQEKCDQETLDQLFSDIKSLQLLLVG